MKILFILSLLIGLTLTHITAQESDPNFEAAKKQALSENKHILLVFKGSDWCAPCIKLEKEILETDEFLKLAKTKFIIVEADFPRSKKNRLSEEQQQQNNALAEKYNKNGYFPYVLVLNKDGEILGTTGYQKTSPEEYFNTLVSFQ
jgi:thioredoxin-related protein